METEPLVLTPQDALDLEADAARCLDDLWFLVTRVLYFTDIHKYGPFHKWMCDTVGKVSGTRELWLLPRDHFKTTILTIGHAIQQILRDPQTSLIIVSRKDEHAALMSEEMKRQFVFNDRLRLLFPAWCAPTIDSLGNKQEWIVPAYREVGGHRRREPTVTATGIKSRQQSRHYRWLYADDCMDKEDTTEVGLRQIREDFSELIPLIDKDGGVIMCGTRKHYNDLYQAQMDTGVYKVFIRHGLEHPTKMCAEDECARYAQPHPAPEFKDGAALCPERMERADYERKLKECEIDPKRGRSFFWHEYVNLPFSPSDRKFQPEWFKKIDDAMIPGGQTPFAPLSKWIAIDTAFKDEEHPTGYDFTVMVIGGFDDRGVLYILDILRSKDWTQKQFGETVVSALGSREYGAITRVITEKVGSMGFGDFIRDCGRQAGRPVLPITVSRGGRGAKSKYERIEAVAGYFEQGRVFFRRSCQNFEDCVNEFCNLRRWTNDDIADAISMFYDPQVQVMAPLKMTAPPPLPAFRPMGFEGALRLGSFSLSHPRAATAVNLNDPLGRYGQEGPAFTISRSSLARVRGENA